MALIVEDGTGLANAESLASVEFADDYHSKRGNQTWIDLATERKEQLLRIATDYAVDTYGQSLNGLPVNTTQALPFPRIVKGANIGVPLGVKQAIADLASIARTQPLNPNQTRGKKKVKVGPVEVEYDTTSPAATQFVSASLRFQPFLSGYATGTFARLVRT